MRIVPMTTYSGRLVDLVGFDQRDVCLKDIAHSLAFQCRFAGHTTRFYSVAEHSVNLHRFVDSIRGVQNLERRLAMLLHDASEAYLGDTTGPVHALVYGRLEGEHDRISEKIFKSLWIDTNLIGDEEIHTYDQLLTTCEGACFIGGEYWIRKLAKARGIDDQFCTYAMTEIKLSYNEWETPYHGFDHFYALLKSTYEAYMSEAVNNEVEAANAEPSQS